MAAAKTQLLENLTLKYILKGEVRVPSNVSFFKIFTTGPDSRRCKQTIKKRHISSISQNTVHAATSVLKKTHTKIGSRFSSEEFNRQ